MLRFVVEVDVVNGGEEREAMRGRQRQTTEEEK